MLSDAPEIKMTGLSEDVDVKSVSIGTSRYKCSYVPKTPGETVFKEILLEIVIVLPK